MPRVPTTKDVVPGASVNIVLKVDQPTGRTVSGTVATLLTRGNHPRGIKVRLTDGRVGRVQSIGSGVEGESGQMTPMLAPAPSRNARSAPELPSEQIGLDAYITKPRNKRKAKSGNNRDDQPVDGNKGFSADQSSGVVVCPVCEDFKGDEAAVVHHVSNHFAD